MPHSRPRPCKEPGCGQVQPCPKPGHANRADRDRGTARARGYDAAHDSEARAAKAEAVARGDRCPRCGEVMRPGEALDYGHSKDRVLNPGSRADRVEHASCNRTAGGKLAHRRGMSE